jgi:hypothetical protein
MRLARSARWRAGLFVVTATVALSLLASSAEAQRRRRRAEPEPEPEPAAASPATIVLIGESPGAEVLVDEQPAGTLPLSAPLTVEPGRHTLRIRRAGYTEYTEVITLGPSESYDVFVDLMALAEVLEVGSTPEGAHVFVDETFLGDTPTEVELLGGAHRIRLVLPGYEEVTREIEAVAGTRDRLHVELVPIPPDDGEQWYESPLTWVGVGGGLVAVGVVVTVVAVVLSDQSVSQESEFCQGGTYPCFRVETRF